MLRIFTTREYSTKHAAEATFGVALVVSAVSFYLWKKMMNGRVLHKPYKIKDILAGEKVGDPQAELVTVITWLQDAIIRPIDMRLPGHPFEYDLHAFPFTPMVLMIGNHSAGKSTFINRLLGMQVQETGVAPTDDGFTVLERHPSANEEEDGPTLLGCPDNRPFRELQRFGTSFFGHLRRKKLKLAENSSMPYGLQIVDTPGMIDMPVHSESIAGGRGYNFPEVVRWFAKRADLILLLFDPHKPGTTGEVLDVLTRSLAGLDHKFLIVLNKLDQLDNSVDFARAYGTLGWALSKVIPRKDVPHIYTMYNALDGVPEQGMREHKLPLDAFRKKQEEVVGEVLRAKVRHWDNVITATEDTLRQIEMVATVSTAVSTRVRKHHLQMQCSALLVLGVPGLVAGRIFHMKWNLPHKTMIGFWLSYAFVCLGTGFFLWDSCKQYERLQVMNLDSFFEQAYAKFFIHSDGEDLRARWENVRPKIANMFRFVPTVASLLPIASWETCRIHECLNHDIWYLRLLAKRIRTPAA